MSSSPISLNTSQTTSTVISTTKKLSASKYPVYLASNFSNTKQLALKFFPYNHPHYIKEKNILQALQHPHIVTLYETIDNALLIGEQQKSCIGLEYAPYGDLLDVISSYGKIPEILARTLFHHLIDALSYMHNSSFVHLDLKVDNILINEHFELKVTDFDLSQSAHSTKLDAKGTPGCRAPEVKEGTCEDLKAADVYSAGIVLFIMLSGNPPYSEVSRGYQLEFDTLYKTMRKQNKKFWEAHSRHRGDSNFYSEEFKELIGRMLEEDPLKRATIEEVREMGWFKGSVLDNEVYRVEMKKYMKQDEEML